MKTVGQAVKDAASMRLFKPVKARVVERLKELTDASSAVSESFDIGEERQWVTSPPKMFIKKLSGGIQNGVGIITYYKYATRKNKKTGELEKAPRTIKRQHPFDPKTQIDHEVVYPITSIVKETIEYGKATKIDETFYEDVIVDSQ